MTLALAWGEKDEKRCKGALKKKKEKKNGTRRGTVGDRTGGAPVGNLKVFTNEGGEVRESVTSGAFKIKLQGATQGWNRGGKLLKTTR